MSKILSSQFNTGKERFAGRTSQYDVEKQLQGYLDWALKVKKPEELIITLLRMYRKEMKNYSGGSLQSRKDFLEKLRLFYAKKLQVVNQEIRRTEKHLGVDGDESQW